MSEMGNNKALIRAEHLRKEFRSSGMFSNGAVVRALNDVSLDIYPGEVLGVVGESGCGKSTLARVILNLIPPTDGKVWFDGRDMSTLTKKEQRDLRKDMQIIFQDPYSSLNPRMPDSISL